MAETESKREYRRWAVTVTHKSLVEAIQREMDGYLVRYSELVQALGHPNPDHSVLDERRTVIVILIASYLEAIINVYFAFAFNADELEAIDRKPLIEKWTKMPARRLPSYTFDETGDLFANLKALVACRNALVHMRPEFSVDDKVIHGGNGHPLEVVSHEMIMKWAKLPLDLVDNIKKQDKSDAGDTLSSVSDVWMASQGWDDRLKFYQEQYASGRGKKHFSGYALNNQGNRK